MASKRPTLSRKTRFNWLIDAATFFTAITAILSGIYFLYLPNGYQGGRNPWYDVTIIFGRATWTDLHTWGGLLMVAAVVIHLALHLAWIKSMGKKVGHGLRGQDMKLSRPAKINLLIDAVIALSFLLTAISGLYFFFTPEGPARPAFIWSSTAWDMVHTWGAVILILAALAHFAIHWRWIKNVTYKFFGTRPANRRADQIA